ncbi:hypothetical protein GYA49_00195 [Candidatus Beckwithbacteria bacterium]|nr:hypothetical protein [Candidatus Beckwithbacteria bacterium]
MNSVTQEDSLGCSLACIAQLTHKSYQAILKLVDHQKAQTQGFYCKELVSILSYLGYNYNYKYLKPRLKKLIYTNGVIVFIKRSKKYPNGHYLIRVNKTWMDPWINFSATARIIDATAGFRKRLPGTPIYALFPRQILVSEQKNTCCYKSNNR